MTTSSGSSKKPFGSTTRPQPRQQSNSGWLDPQPLHGKLLPVEKLRPEMIPEPLRAWVEDVAHRMQCPIDYVAAPTICALSSVIGAGCSIRPKRLDDWAVIPNTWGGVVAPSGRKKSPAIEAALLPVKRLERKALEEFEQQMVAHAVEVAAYKAQHNAINYDMERASRTGGMRNGVTFDQLKEKLAKLKEPKKPACRRFLTNDVTIAKVGILTKENPRGIMLSRDELIGLLVQWDREDRREDRAFHLEAWNGYGSYRTDRVERGTTISLNLCEVIFGGIQPSKLIAYLALTTNNIENDGLLQRFQLLVCPDDLGAQTTVVDQEPKAGSRDKVYVIFEALAEMDFTKHGAELNDHAKVPYFHFSDEAQEFFYEWYLDLDHRRRAESEDIMIEHLSKFDSLMPSLALIFHLAEIANWSTSLKRDDPEPSKSVSLHCAKLAVEWCDYLESHARRIYGLAGSFSLQSAKKLLKKIRDGEIRDGFNARDVYSKNWSFLDTEERAIAAIKECIATGWLRAVPSPRPATGRPPTPTYEIHPRAVEILKKQQDE